MPGRGQFIMKPSRDTGSHAPIVIFRQKVTDISGPREQPVCGTCGLTGQKIQHHSTGRKREDWRMHGYILMKAAVLNAMRIFFLPNLPKKERMHIFIISRQRKLLIFTVSTAILMPGIILKVIPMEAIKHSELHLLHQKRFSKNQPKVSEFKSFTEQVPNSSISFNMIAIPGGRFKMGSPAGEPFRKEDEGPVKEVEISPFFMAEVEVTWDEYLAFYAQTSAEGRSTDTEGIRSKQAAETDAISGATPPYGQPDQGWGMGQRPAISFTYHAAETYCKWLVTGYG